MSIDARSPRPASERPVHWPSAVQFGLSLFAMALLLGVGMLMLITGVLGALMRPETRDQLLPLLLMTASILYLGLLLAPSVYHGLLRLLDRPALNTQALFRRVRPEIWLLFFPVVALVGFLASQTQVTSWLILPALHLLGVGLPIAWMVGVATRDLPLGSSQRMWGVFASGLVLGPGLISILEGIAVLGALGIVAVSLVSQPELQREVLRLWEAAQFSRTSPEEMIPAFSAYMLKPGVIFGSLAMGAVIVPLIEEALKPIGVWLLAGRRLSAAAGFAAGAISGAGFALSESMLLSSNGSDWTTLILVRIGTGCIHILTAALTGWGLAQAWKHGRYARLGLAYLTAVLIHGLWNGLTIASIFAGAAAMQGNASSAWSGLLIASPAGLVFLAMGALFLLARFNRRLAARPTPTRAPDVAPPAPMNEDADEV